jgi:hypothetical protein
MNSTILRKVMMLAVLLVGYLSVMGACSCEECCNVDKGTLCNNGSGYCSGGDCIPGDPPPLINRCAGLNEGDPCEISDQHTGTCVTFSNVLSCLVIVELPSP